MKTKKDICFCCCKSKKLSEEHIIPQALGGKLVARIYCQSCNSEFGKGIDAELINSIGFLGTALNIKRVRGKSQPYDVALTKDGTKLTFNGKEFKRKKPIVKIEKNGGKIKYVDVRARSESEVKKIFSNIKKKYDLPDVTNYFKENHPGPTDTVTEFVFDNEKIRRCVAKTAYSLLCVKLLPSQIFTSAFEEIRDYIRHGGRTDMATANFTHTDFMTDYIRPLHKIHISMNRQKNIIIGFICFFGTFRYTVLLSKDYKSVFEWPGLDYTFDPVTSKEIFGNPNFRAPELEINEVLSPKHSKQLVLKNIAMGFKILENYRGDHQFLKIKAEE